MSAPTHETTHARASTTTAGPVPEPDRRVARLAAQAGQAARVRELTTDPDVIALRVERVRTQVDALLWAGIVLGLAFTMVNVQSFAAAGSPAGSAAWWVAWLLDPMVSLVLLAVLRAEQVTARYQVALPAWARRTKWLTFCATYLMNTWTSWGFDGGSLSAAGIVLHSVPPALVFAAAETGPVLRDRLTEAVHRSLTEHTTRTTAAPAPTGPADVAPGRCAPDVAPVHDPDAVPIHDPASQTAPQGAAANAGQDPGPSGPTVPARRAATTASTGRRRAARPRRLLSDYVHAAQDAFDVERTAGRWVDPTPAWCREVTGCSAGTSVKVAAALRDQHPDQAENAPRGARPAHPETTRHETGQEVAA